ncbi:hypothetical protein IWZ01DRAFT_343561 [Phyllosticta capitalensis]
MAATWGPFLEGIRSFEGFCVCFIVLALEICLYVLETFVLVSSGAESVTFSSLPRLVHVHLARGIALALGRQNCWIFLRWRMIALKESNGEYMSELDWPTLRECLCFCFCSSKTQSCTMALGCWVHFLEAGCRGGGFGTEFGLCFSSESSLSVVQRMRFK